VDAKSDGVKIKNNAVEFNVAGSFSKDFFGQRGVGVPRVDPPYPATTNLDPKSINWQHHLLL
jgi:hypothetical protein